MKVFLAAGFVLLASICPAQQTEGAGLKGISPRIWHLGNDATPEWSEAPAKPEGSKMSVTFEAKAFSGEGVLFLRQRDVNNTWILHLNGEPFATLDKSSDELVEFYYAIPSGRIVDGTNTLSLMSVNPADDILIGDLRYSEKSIREHFNLRPVAFQVSKQGEAGREDMPARITVVDASGALAKMFYADAEHVAVRPGVLYTGTGHAKVELPVGDYVVYASRGMEWSRAKVALHVDETQGAGEQPAVELHLVHEVDTPGYIAADTHIHTLTHSGHGDASVEERQLTLAGEGVELAIATDHNHNIDYAPAQAKLGLRSYYTTVVGNEVTTPIGHFNAFPLDPKAAVPPHESRDLSELLAGMRASGARTIILNHPRWPEGDKAPFATIGLDSRTGFWKGPWASGYDAMELVNSDTKEEDPLQLYRDWFSLLNRGLKVMSVGASDSHEVGIVVGQGRTYVRSVVDDVSALDVVECSDNIARGHSSVSMGIFAEATLNGEPIMGKLVTPEPGYPIPEGLELRFAAPSWVHSKRLILFANGQQILASNLRVPSGEEGSPMDARIQLDTGLAYPDHDFWLVAVALGDKVTEPFWPLRNDYTLASTNPIFVDVDGDGKFSCALDIAEKGLAEVGTGHAEVLKLLSKVDGAVAAQILRLVGQDYRKQAEDRIHDLGREAVKQEPILEDWVGEQD